MIIRNRGSTSSYKPMARKGHLKKSTYAHLKRSRQPRFHMDEGLLSLGEALAFGGYDVTYADHYDGDDPLHLSIARREARVFVTRDERRFLRERGDLAERPGIVCIKIPQASVSDLTWAIYEVLRFYRTRKAFNSKGILMTRTQMKEYRSGEAVSVVAARKDLLKKGAI